MKLFIDIETIPSQNPALRDAIEVKPPGNIKKPESIAKWHEENGDAAIEEQYQKFSLDGAMGEILCIAYAFNDKPPKIVCREKEEDEGVMLREFMDDLIEVNDQAKLSGAFKWIGHYITGFDLRYIWQRCVANGVMPLVNIPLDAKPWETDKVYDTCIQWAGIHGSGTGKLDKICKSLGHEGKQGMDGSQVWDYVKAGRYDEVFQYCKDDVEMTRWLYNKMNFIK